MTDPLLQEDDLVRASDILNRGGLVVFPTETVYGLGGNGLDDNAAKKIYAAKGRPSDNPLIIHIAAPEDAERYAVTNETYYRLAKAFMPGPLTVILPKRDIVPTSVTGGLDTVAVRCPSHPVAHRLIELAKIPIAAPSANLSGKPSPTSSAHVAQDMDGRVDMILDGGDCEIGLESTIVKIDGDALTLLRPGGITYDALCIVCEHVTVADAVTHQLAEGERPLSPGMKYRHYAPTAPVVLLDGDANAVLRFLQAEQSTKQCAVLCYDEETPFLEERDLFPIGARDDLKSQAKRLFSALREADHTDAEIIYAHLPPLDGLEAGANPLDVQERLGHSHLAITWKYAHNT
ncbi:MAG: threonylcarbamoyl-AMP synthase, partial [Clostridia bacterium]|nr:threonylcarbamoyl-AMP synthase [Clostridia bacterium]